MVPVKSMSHDRDEQVHAGVDNVQLEAIIERRAGPAMMVLAPPMRLIHMNQYAWDLSQKLSEAEARGNKEGSCTAKGLVPRAIRNLAADILSHLRQRPDAKDWKSLESKRLIVSSGQHMLLRGFGIPDRINPDQARVVLLIEEFVWRKQPVQQQAPPHFQLTEREETVVSCLAKGWTNKEIAAFLKITVPTVKEHIHNIMEKTRTTTRTGILAELFYK